MIPSHLFETLKKGARNSAVTTLITSGECKAILEALVIVNVTSAIARDFPSDYVIALTPDKTTLFARKRLERE